MRFMLTFGSMNTPVLIDTLGLLIDIVGVLLLWVFGFPAAEISRVGKDNVGVSNREDGQIATPKVYESRARLALSLILIGFVLQMISNFLK